VDRAENFLRGAPVLVLAPHPDDEVLGCGALLADCWGSRTSAHVACLTDGAASHPRSAKDIASIRALELARAVEILGGDARSDLTRLGYSDAALHLVPSEDIIARLEALIDKLESRVLIAPSPLDPHCDHVTAAAVAVHLASRRPQMRLLFYPIWSRWVSGGAAPPVPGTRRISYPVDSRSKCRAIAAHASQQGKVIQDDPDGFAMPDGFAQMFAEGPEVYDELGG
jgi:LmbE family N-acetylglucosaminyl deacetylase